MYAIQKQLILTSWYKEVNCTELFPEVDYMYASHRDCSIRMERANMHCQGIACTRSFDMALTSA
jgi:hypothetical protein